MFARNVTGQKIAEEKLRTTEESLQVERLRTRIAADLHDDIGSTLSSTSIFSELLAKEVGPSSERAGELMERIAQNLRDVQQGLQDIVWTIIRRTICWRMSWSACTNTRPTSLRQGESDLRENSRLGGFIPDPHGVRRELYLVVKEGIHNIVKHARARRVTLEAELEGDLLVITLTDDGVGFDPLAWSKGTDCAVYGGARSRWGECHDRHPSRPGTRMVFRVRIA